MSRQPRSLRLQVLTTASGTASTVGTAKLASTMPRLTRQPTRQPTLRRMLRRMLQLIPPLMPRLTPNHGLGHVSAFARVGVWIRPGLNACSPARQLPHLHPSNRRPRLLRGKCRASMIPVGRHRVVARHPHMHSSRSGASHRSRLAHVGFASHHLARHRPTGRRIRHKGTNGAFPRDLLGASAQRARRCHLAVWRSL